MPSRKKDLKKLLKARQQELRDMDIYDGERLSCLLNSIKKELEVEKDSNTSLPDKLWLKQQFAIGVNEVTRVLERMSPSVKNEDERKLVCGSLIRLQAVLVAWDCDPKMLMKHLPHLAASRDVPIIYVRDHKRGSIRLGDLVGLKTAIAIGVKVKGSLINKVLERILGGEELASAEKLT